MKRWNKKSKRELIQGVIAQLEKDLIDGDYEAMDEMFNILMAKKENCETLFAYLGDGIVEQIQEDKLSFKY